MGIARSDENKVDGMTGFERKIGVNHTNECAVHSDFTFLLILNPSVTHNMVF